MYTKTILQTVAITEKSLVELQISAMMGAFRANTSGESLVPGQLGGLYGQREILADQTPLTITRLKPVQES